MSRKQHYLVPRLESWRETPHIWVGKEDFHWIPGILVYFVYLLNICFMYSHFSVSVAICSVFLVRLYFYFHSNNWYIWFGFFPGNLLYGDHPYNIGKHFRFCIFVHCGQFYRTCYKVLCWCHRTHDNIDNLCIICSYYFVWICMSLLLLLLWHYLFPFSYSHIWGVSRQLSRRGARARNHAVFSLCLKG